jgi:hypothetical protein
MGGRKSCLNLSLSFLLIGILIFATLFSISTFRVNPAYRFGIPVHEGITETALSFLEPEMSKINSGHTNADLVHQFSLRYHFDGCAFQDGTEHINRL